MKLLRNKIHNIYTQYVLKVFSHDVTNAINSLLLKIF